MSAETRAGWLTISPWIVGFIVFTAYPFFASLYFSFTDYNMLSSAEWVGFQNYSDLMDDDLFWTSLRVTVMYSTISVPMRAGDSSDTA